MVSVYPKLARVLGSAGFVSPPNTYFVDPNGSDLNDGRSPSTAWKTPAKVAATTIPPGSSVLFKGGAVFDGFLYLNETQHSGAAGLITTYGSYGGGVATFNVTTSTDDAIWLQDVQYVNVRDFKLVGPGRTVALYAGLEVLISKPSNARLKGVTFSNIEISGFNSGILIWSSASDGTTSGYDDLRIENCVVHDCCANGNGIFVGSDAIGLLNKAASHLRMVINGCKVYDNPGGYTSPTSHSGSGILLSQCDGAIIQNCEAYNNGAGNTYAAGPVGIWCYDSKNCIIQFCESHHNKTGSGTADGGGFDLDGGCQGCTVQYCYSHDNYGPGFLMYQYLDTANILALSNNTIRYCVSENDCAQDITTKGSIHIASADTTRDCSANHMYGNVIYSSRASASGFFVGANPNRLTNSKFSNNIIYLTGSGSKMVNSSSSTSPGTATTALRLLANCYYAPTISIKWGSTTYTTFASWQSAFSLAEKFSSANTYVNADPLFVGSLPLGNTGGFNPANMGAYKLQTGSPCKNAGNNLSTSFSISTGSRDLFGNTVPQGSYDMGCYEQA